MSIDKSLVIPVYRNAEHVDELVRVVVELAERVHGTLEVVLVVDGSPDDSHARLRAALAGTAVAFQLLQHSRNFGSFAAIRTGMRHARGATLAVMAADLQEPPELIERFFARLDTGEVDVVAGRRESRDDRGDSAAKAYWRLYRQFVMPDMPASGVDVFGCTAEVRDVLVGLEDQHTSLVAQLFWVGFRRELVGYDRLPREGESGWTFRRKLRYLSDSVFAFTDLPVRVLWAVGLLGLALGATLALLVLVLRLTGAIDVPGYTATILVVVFFAGLNCVGLGIIGSYVYRAYELVKGRPGAIVRDRVVR